MEKNTNSTGAREPGQLAFPVSVVPASADTSKFEVIAETSLVVVPRRRISVIPAPLELVVDVTPRVYSTVAEVEPLMTQVKTPEPLMTQAQAIKTLGLPLDSPWADVERARTTVVATTESRGGRTVEAKQANSAYSVYLAARMF